MSIVHGFCRIHCAVKNGAYISTVKSPHESKLAYNYSQFLHMSCFFVPLSCRLNCSMFTDDEGSDEDLDDNCSVENERYILVHVKFLPQNNNINLEVH